MFGRSTHTKEIHYQPWQVEGVKKLKKNSESVMSIPPPKGVLFCLFTALRCHNTGVTSVIYSDTTLEPLKEKKAYY